jgi:alkylation response protein AidB-like acyl-CoA dehydrogenase
MTVTSNAQAGPLAGAELPDDRMRALDRYWRELAEGLREPGAMLDRNPAMIERFLDLTAVQFIRDRSVPTPYRACAGLPSDLLDAAETCLGLVVAMEHAAYGDPNIVLAAPGPALSGAVVRSLASEAQAKWYYTRLATAPMFTFFALTEPGKGSAASELTTSLTPAPDGDGWLLNGAKRYVGNGADAPFGVVFCRRAPGPWGIEAVLVDAASPGFSAGHLPTIGLRGARISWLRFDNVGIPTENLLGAHLRPSQRGLRGALAGLYQFRPGIAALALGCAEAARDYLGEHRPRLPKADQFQLDGLADQLAAVRRLLYKVAADVDRGNGDPHRIGAVKAAAARLAEEMTTLVARLLGPASLIEHPWLEKICRDVRAFEIMEGTTNLHLLSVLQGLLNGTYLTTWNTSGDGDAARD